jgi:EAL domain-containing protein (putative c-di-GMP-specific phosphodiesterase class I)
MKGNLMKQNQRLQRAIIEVVENQIEANDPPEIKQTLDRLISAGFSILKWLHYPGHTN